MTSEVEQSHINGLLDATTSRNVSQIEVLMQHGADPCVPTTDGTCPIHKAALLESPAGACIVSIMLGYGADPNVKTVNGLSPLHIAAMWGRVETINVLLDNGADVTLKDHDDKSPLDYAEHAEDCRYESIDALTRYRKGRDEVDSGCEINGCYYESNGGKINPSPPINYGNNKNTGCYLDKSANLNGRSYLEKSNECNWNYYLEAVNEVNSSYYYENGNYYGDGRNNINTNHPMNKCSSSNGNYYGDTRNYYWSMENNMGGNYGGNINGNYCVNKGDNINGNYYGDNNRNNNNNNGHYYGDNENNINASLNGYDERSRNYYWNNPNGNYPTCYVDKSEINDIDRTHDGDKGDIANRYYIDTRNDINENCYVAKGNDCYRNYYINKGKTNGNNEEVYVDDFINGNKNGRYNLGQAGSEDNGSYTNNKDIDRCKGNGVSSKGGSTISEISEISDSDEDGDGLDSESTNDSFWSVSSVPNIEDSTVLDTLIRKLDEELVIEEGLSASPPLVDYNKVIVIMCGLQESYRSKVEHFDTLRDTAQRLLSAMSLLDVPVLVTDASDFGQTVKEMDVSMATIFNNRTSFSGLNTDLKNYLTTMKKKKKISDVILFGLEAHICIQLTALDLIAAGYNVHVVADATFSKSHDDRMFALYRIRQSGGFVTTFESIMHLLLTDQQHPQYASFKKLITNLPSTLE